MGVFGIDYHTNVHSSLFAGDVSNDILYSVLFVSYKNIFASAYRIYMMYLFNLVLFIYVYDDKICNEFIMFMSVVRVL